METTHRIGETICKPSDKGLSHNIQSASKGQQEKKIRQLNLKSGKRPDTGISPKKICKWPLGTWKELGIISHEWNVNQKHKEIPLHTH